MTRVLLIGYGNPGRLDDGLGPALAEAVADLAIEGVTVESGYQLQVEDAARVAEHDVVLFADADVACPDPFELRPVAAEAGACFSTHAVSPGRVLALAREHFGAETPGFVLAIRGHEFDGFGERLSDRARENLAAALRFVEPVLRERRLPGGEGDG